MVINTPLAHNFESYFLLMQYRPLCLDTEFPVVGCKNELSLLVGQFNGFPVGGWDEEAEGGNHALLTLAVLHPPLDLLTVVQQQTLLTLGDTHLKCQQ